MPKPHNNQFVGDPWTIAAEAALRERPGVSFISLLTDEAGAKLIAEGIVPAYVKQQAREALEWCQTDERGVLEAYAREERKTRRKAEHAETP